MQISSALSRIDGAIGDASLAGNISYLGVEIAIMSEDADSGAQDSFTLIANWGTGGV